MTRGSQIEQGTGVTGMAEHPLVRIRAAGQHRLDLHRLVPVVGGRHRAVVRAEADQHGLVAEGLLRQFADIELPAPAHLRRRGVPDMGIVRPHHRLAQRPAAVQQVHQRVEHMPVTQVPGVVPGPIHHPVVLLGGLHHPGILSRVEAVLVILEPQLHLPCHDRSELLHHCRFARVDLTGDHRPAVPGRLSLPGGQAPIAAAGL